MKLYYSDVRIDYLGEPVMVIDAREVKSIQGRRFVTGHFFYDQPGDGLPEVIECPPDIDSLNLVILPSNGSRWVLVRDLKLIKEAAAPRLNTDIIDEVFGGF